MIFSHLKRTFFIASIAATLFHNVSNAQLTVNTGVTPTFLVQNVLLGGGLTASGITYTGNANARGTFNGSAFIFFSSSSVGGISGVVFILHQTEPIEQTEPRIKEAKTQFGILPV